MNKYCGNKNLRGLFHLNVVEGGGRFIKFVQIDKFVLVLFKWK